MPFLGFGAKLPPYYNVASSCFAVNGDIFMPEESGIEDLGKVYKKAMDNIELHGPSSFAPIIKFVT
jgi:hypothetical protein